MKAFITGGAGFIGSNMADLLLKEGHEVVVYDNFSTGFDFFTKHNLSNGNYQIINADVLDKDTLISSMKGSDFVFHFQANADVRGGISNTSIDLEQNTIATHNVLEGMRINGIKKIAFSSSATVYGEPDIFPTPENVPLIQTSLYGASKLSAEAMIQAYCEYFNMQNWIFRFVSFMGNRYTHGVVYDFMKKIKEDPENLHILGNGKQRKSYLHVYDGVNAIYTAINNANERTNIFNLGNKEFLNVVDVADIICNEMGINDISYSFSGGDRGWIGDSPFVHLDTTKIIDIGWQAKYSVRDSIKETVKYLSENNFLFKKRS